MAYNFGCPHSWLWAEARGLKVIIPTEYADPCSVPSFLQTTRWAPVDAISGHCQLMSQPETLGFRMDYVGGKPK